MAFKITDSNKIGYQQIAAIDTVQNHPLGTIVKAVDPTLGEGEFIYLLGVASTAVGTCVVYNATTHQTALLPDTAGLAQPIAVAMSANVADSYGWYQIGGLATVLKTAVAVSPDVALYVSATAGQLMPTPAAGKQVLNARSANLATVAAGTPTVVVSINRPHMQGQIT